MKFLTTLMLLTFTAVATADELIEPAVSELKLRPQAHVSAGPLKLADVLNFAQADPRLREALADKPVFGNRTADAAATPTDVTHEQIVRRLEELGVNLSRVLVSGALTCRVTVEPPADPAPAPAVAVRPSPPASSLPDSAVSVASDESPLRANPKTAGEGKTLADALRAFINCEVMSLGGTAEVEFERAGQEFLELTAPPWEFSIQSGNAEKLGLREFRITFRRDGRAERTARLGARVRLVKNVLVARKGLNIGAPLKRDDVALEPRIFENGKDLGLDRLEPLVGQQVKKFVAAGDMLRTRDLKPTDLVQRSKPVTLLSAGRDVRMRLSGVALDSGTYGDTVRVRIGESYKDRREVRGIVTGPNTVRIAEDGP